MKHSITKCNEDLYRSNTFDFYFRDMRICVLDIETTGLNPSRNKFILGGLYDCSTHTMHQFFAENRSEEQEALAGFLSELDSFDMVITYNGRHFDIPFIEKRLKTLYNDHEQDITGAPRSDNRLLQYNLDLYLAVNGHSPLKHFIPNLKQKTVENYMGLWHHRKDEISGAESVDLYNAYEKSGEIALRDKILLHNSDDVIQLTRLSKVTDKCDFHKAMYYLGFPAGSLTIRRIHTGRDFITAEGIQRKTPTDYRCFMSGDFPVDAQFDRTDRTFSITIPAVRDSGMLIADLEAFGINSSDFAIYPGYGSGFLILEDPQGHRHMEINHFIKEFIKKFLLEI